MIKKPDVSKLKNRLSTFAKTLKPMVVEITYFLFFFLIFVINEILTITANFKHSPPQLKKVADRYALFLEKVTKKYDSCYGNSITRFEIFGMAMKNMSAKKTRSIITIGGMAIGVGAIVFLVSLGYGLQQLVVEKVARLDELKQATVSIQPGSNLVLDDKVLSDFRDISNVKQVLPLIGVVAKTNYQGSISDVAVYGVETDYLKSSAVLTAEGNLFESIPFTYVQENITDTSQETSNEESVQGASDTRKYPKFGDYVREVKYFIYPKSWIAVRQSADPKGEVLGYTRRTDYVQLGEEIYGKKYYDDDKVKFFDENSNPLEKWVKTKVLLWNDKKCESSAECEDGHYFPLKDSEGNQISYLGYIDEYEIMIYEDSSGSDKPEVLGLTTDTNTPESTRSYSLDVSFDTGDLDWLDTVLNIAKDDSTIETKKVKMPDVALKEAVVNAAFLEVLGLTRNEAVGKYFDTSFIVTSGLLGNGQSKLESEMVSFKIVGVVPENNSPFFYVSIYDLKSLGITNYSQVKVIVDGEASLVSVREKIEAMGFVTSSVVDTVNQINSLFSTARILLGFVGSIALAVASFGMFNTLTVSLLERTREVGLMKALGMTSEEVKRLFLTESLIMGFMGGLGGIVLGFTGGKLLSLLLSIFSIFKGVGLLDISYLPIFFIVIVFFLSLIVGIVTGIYPSKRATKISALDALRYE